MTEAQAVAFLEALRATQIRVKDNGWVEATCPLARWTHKHHRDHTPSFGLRVAPGEPSYFLCFACRQGSANELLYCIQMYSKGTVVDYDFARCYQILADEAFVVPLGEYQEFPHPAQVFTEWPRYLGGQLPPAAVSGGTMGLSGGTGRDARHVPAVRSAV